MKKDLEIIYTEDIGNTPAAINRFSGVLYINPAFFPRLTPFQQKFILAHEEGHYYLNTPDEFKADAYAFNKLAGTEFQSLKQIVACLPSVLDVKNIGLKPRYVELYKLACKWDYINNNNLEALEHLKWLNEYGHLDFGQFGFITYSSDTAGDTYYKQQQANALFQQQMQVADIANKNANTGNMTMIMLFIAVLAAGFLLYKKM